MVSAIVIGSMVLGESFPIAQVLRAALTFVAVWLVEPVTVKNTEAA